MKDWDISINYGIKTGFNDAFIVSGAKRDEILANCKTDEEREKTAELIRPILRGRDIKRYSYNWADLWLIYIPWHFPLQFDQTIQGASEKAEKEFKKQYPAVYAHLLQYKRELSARNKAETGIRYEWYAMQRWGANYWDEFNKPKICWARLMRLSKSDLDSFPRFSLVSDNFMVVDSLCFFTGNNTDLLVKELNSEFATWYFFNNVAILDNGGFQMRQQYIEEIPLPIITDNQNSIDEQIYKAFSFTREEIDFIKSAISNKKNEIANRCN
ncbi:TaqI-like C-terminal specificity domain-containing protein [uncultured Treponema sp.]|uniref:TaqI-like C-terminal specificity domain-containing protein n=1 Tax=uncultured Treponema sp. TaxID=162155 RepID=UPI00262059DC|nr:TaqI-like C-terminal specificity domain-containing protein [uncultured Treponema sp.]